MLKIFKWVLMSYKDFNEHERECYDYGFRMRQFDLQLDKETIINMLEDVDTWDKGLIKNIQRLVGEL